MLSNRLGTGDPDRHPERPSYVGEDNPALPATGTHRGPRSPPRRNRGRQGNRKRVRREDHKSDQPLDGTFAVGVEADLFARPCLAARSSALRSRPATTRSDAEAPVPLEGLKSRPGDLCQCAFQTGRCLEPRHRLRRAPRPSCTPSRGRCSNFEACGRWLRSRLERTSYRACWSF